MTCFKLQCEIDAGWASLTFSDGERKDAIFFSQVFDGLEKLIDAALALNEGRTEVETHLFADAESFVFRLEQESGQIVVRLYNFHEWTEEQPLANIKHRGILLFEGECTLKEFTLQIVQLFQQLKRANGAEGYAKKWGHQFPSDKLERLKAIILRRRINFLMLLFL